METLLDKNEITSRIDLFEENWAKWSIEDTVEWFKYVLNCKEKNNINDDSSIEDSDTESETETESETDLNENKAMSKNNNIINNNNEDEKKSENENTNLCDVDFDSVSKTMRRENFLPKHFLIAMDKKDLIKIGFKTRNDYRLIYKQTKMLVVKYPKGKKSRKNRKKSRNREIDNVGDSLRNQVEGIVEDTY